MKVNAIIFDLDGTLLNTINDISESMNRVLIENNLPIHPTKSYFNFIGNGALKLVERAVPNEKNHKILLDTYLKRYREIYEENWNIETKPYKDIDLMLASLKHLEIPISVLSNKPHSDVLKCIEYFFETNTFAEVSGQKNGIPHKPAPDGVFNIINKLGVNKKETIFVGDSSVDIKTAKAACITSVGVSWGFRTKEELLDNGADYIIDNPLELLKII